ncbi:MAG: 50S ribosomal protein L30 [Muribaculaceae bacterium]|nr:50S ribosomal protein L30 [Muribaculaceae bacterium]MCF0219591.1 50S ribosomal protein L30 [Muribaculaceae bacterium]
MANVKITQVKSRIGAPAVQKRTLDALGLKKLNHSVVKEDCPSLRGMINRVRHLVEVTPA